MHACSYTLCLLGAIDYTQSAQPESCVTLILWQNYDPEAWTDSIEDPETIFAAPPAKCKKGGAKVRIHCGDDGNYDGKTIEGQEHIDALAAVANKVGNVEGLTHDQIHKHYTEALEVIRRWTPMSHTKALAATMASLT